MNQYNQNKEEHYNLSDDENFYINTYVDVDDDYNKNQNRQRSGQCSDWEVYSEPGQSSGSIECAGTCYDTEEKENNTTDICVVAGTIVDNKMAHGTDDLLHKMWQAAKPPAKMSIKRPIVTARQLEIVRGQITGELPRKSKHRIFVKCDEEICSQIYKFVGMVKNNRQKRRIRK